MHANPVADADRGLGIGNADMDVQRERRLATRELAHRPVDELVAVATGDGDLVPDRKRVCPGDGRAKVERLERAEQPARSPRISSTAEATSEQMPVCTSTAESWVSAHTCGCTSSGSRGRTSSIRCASAHVPGSSSIASSSTPSVQGRRSSPWAQTDQAGPTCATELLTWSSYPRRGRRNRRRREGAEQRLLLGAGGQQLDVPLDADQKRPARVLDRPRSSRRRPGR